MDVLNITNGDIILEFIYLVSALLFVVGLKLLSSPDSARRGNLWAFAGMILAMIGTEMGPGIPLRVQIWPLSLVP